MTNTTRIYVKVQVEVAIDLPTPSDEVLGELRHFETDHWGDEVWSAIDPLIEAHTVDLATTPYEVQDVTFAP